MRLSKSGIHGYEGISWMDALSGIKSKPKDQEAHLLSQVGQPENIDNALEVASNLAFGTPTKEKSQMEVLQEKTRHAMDSAEKASELAYATTVKSKLADNNVDPVALGVIKKEEWDACVDPKRLDGIAVKAAQKQIEINKNAWQANGLKTSTPSGFDAHSKEGKIVPMAGRADDSAPVVQRQMPANSNSIFDPGRLDRLVAEVNKHDEMVSESKAAKAEQAGKSKDWRTSQHEVPEDVTLMHGSAVQKSGGHDYIETRYKAPSNQISILDDISANSPEELQQKISALFTDKVRDSRKDIRDHNKERSEKIHRKPVDTQKLDSMHEQVKSPVSTSDIQKRLMDLWTSPKK